MAGMREQRKQEQENRVLVWIPVSAGWHLPPLGGCIVLQPPGLLEGTPRLGSARQLESLGQRRAPCHCWGLFPRALQ